MRNESSTQTRRNHQTALQTLCYTSSKTLLFEPAWRMEESANGAAFASRNAATSWITIKRVKPASKHCTSLFERCQTTQTLRKTRAPATVYVALCPARHRSANRDIVIRWQTAPRRQSARVSNVKRCSTHAEQRTARKEATRELQSTHGMQ